MLFHSDPQEHIGITFLFENGNVPVVMSLVRWEGDTPRLIGQDSQGFGRRMLSVFDPGAPKEYIIELVSRGSSVSGVLQIARTSFQDGMACQDDCSRLLQLPLPLIHSDGYKITRHTLFRYQFGRRDVLMFIRYAAKQMSASGYGCIIPLDLSQWDGKTPGTDIGKPRHRSHRNGIDADLSLYDNAAKAQLRSFCDLQQSRAEGEEELEIAYSQPAEMQMPLGSRPMVCRQNQVHDFNAYAIAKLLGIFFELARVKLSFLDRELMKLVIEASKLTLRDRVITKEVAKLFSDGVHFQPWPNHYDHLHIRFLQS